MNENEEDLLAGAVEPTRNEYGQLVDENGRVIDEQQLMEEDEDVTGDKQILEGASGRDKVGDNTQRGSRSRTKELENSKKPRDVVRRVMKNVCDLREKLKERETNKRATTNAMAEFEGLFDEAKERIENDLSIIDAELIAKQSEKKEWKAKYEGEADRARVLEEASFQAVDGTEFSSLEELRHRYDDLCEENTERENSEQGILDDLNLTSMEELVARARDNIAGRQYGTIDKRYRELVSTALEKMGMDDLFEVTKKMSELERWKDAQSKLMAELLSVAKAKDMKEVMEAFQIKELARDALESKYSALQDQVARLQDLVDKRTRERDEANGELEKRNQLELSRRRSELSDSESDTERTEGEKITEQIQRLRNWSLEREQRALPSTRDSEEAISSMPERSALRTTRTIRGQSDKGVQGLESEKEVVVVAPSLSPADLPVLAPYDGTKEKWKLFKAGFLLRYERMGDTGAKVILKEMLTGKAYTEYKGLPKEYESKSIKDCLKWLRDRCFGGTLYESRDIELRLRQLSVRGRKVDVVCEEMEHMVDKLYDSATQREEHKKRELTFLYEHTSEYRELLKLLDEKKTYEDMKRHLQRAEYVDRRDSRYSSEKRNNGLNGKVGGSRDSGGAHSNRSDKRECFICKGVGHGVGRCPSKSDPFGRYKEMKCHVCGGMGHTSKVCASDQSVKHQWKRPTEGLSGTSGGGGQRAQSGAAPTTTTTFTPILPPTRTTGFGQGNGQGGSAKYGSQRGQGNANRVNAYGGRMYALRCDEAEGEVEGTEVPETPKPAKAEDENECPMKRANSQPATVEGEPDEEEALFIKRFRPVYGTIGGVQVEACLDTGADVSLIDKKTVDRMSGVDLKCDTRFAIRDAQGELIRTIGTVVVDVEMNVGRKCKVGFVVADSEIGAILLGNRALESMGLELRMKEELETPGDDVAQATEDRAIVLRTKYIPPREMSTVLVGGGLPGQGPKMLITEKDEVVEGINEGALIVRVPVWNDTDEEMVLEKHDVIGRWSRVTTDESNRNSPQSDEGNLQVNRCATSDTVVDWERIKETLESCRQGKMSGKIEEIIKARADVFAVRDEDLGRLRDMECDIRIEDSCKPIRQKERPVPFSLKPALRKLLDKMITQGVIKRSNSPWLSPVVLVKKKDGSIRICIDFRRVNEVTKEDAFPLPMIESTLQSLQGKKVFTVMDLAAGFWQLPLNRKSAEITAFATMGELYEFTVLPFGLNISPAIFQRAMTDVLKEELSKEGRDRVVHCYIDDVLIATETEEEHERVLAQVLDKLRDNGLLLNVKKCKIMVDEIEYLGHKLSRSGIHIDEKKVQAIREFKRPENMSQLSQYLGMTGYHRRFVAQYAKIVQPMQRLVVTAGRKLLWTDEANAAFELLKDRISSAPVLQQPDYHGAMSGTRPFVLTTDASGCGIGAVLSQESEDGLERPIAFFSRGLRESERSMSVVDTEALAVYEAVIRWKHMVMGARTIVRTDHQPLVTLLKRKNVASRLLRWAAELQEYKLEIEHIKGKSNVVADFLSRNPREELPGENNGYSDDVGVVVNAVTRRETAEARLDEERRRQSREEIEEEENLNKWRVDQSKDEWAVKMIGLLSEVAEGKRDVGEEVTVPGCAMRSSLADWVVEDGILYLLGTDHERKLFIPEGRRDKFIEEIHNSPLSGHLCAQKLTQKLSREVFWGTIPKDVSRVLKKCETCLVANARKRMIPPLQPIIANYPMEVVGIDLVEMGRGVNGGKYIVTVIDHFTKYAGAFSVRDKKAESVADAFLKGWLLQGGRTPKRLVSDNGTELVNQIMNEIAKRFEIDRSLTLPYHSRANGLTERFNRTLVEIMRRIKMRDDQWEEALPFAVYAYNASPHGVTGETPTFLMHGREEKLPNSALPKSNPAYTVDLDVDDYKRRLCWMMEKTRAVVSARLENERRKMKEIYDSKHKNNMNIVPEIGDRVYIKVELKQGDVSKMVARYEGPYRVIAKSNTTVTVVRVDCGIDSGQEKDKRVVQWDRLRLVPRDDNEKDGEENEKGGRRAEARRVRAMDKFNCVDSRVVVDKRHLLHPDTSCEQCGSRKLSVIFPKENVYLLGNLSISTRRELAAIWDRKDEWDDLGLQEASALMKEAVDSKNISSRAYTLAYKKCWCEHMLESANTVDRVGVSIVDEDGAVSDAVTLALARAGGRASRKPLVVLAPRDSVVMKAAGEWKEIEAAHYEDLPAMRRWVESASSAGALPRSLVILLKTTMDKKDIDSIKEFCEETSRTTDITFYITPDILPSAHSLLKSDAVKSQLEMLTNWRLKAPPVNIVVMSAVSGMLWDTNPFVNLFMLANKETKEIFEKAVKNIVEGKPFPFDSLKEKRVLAPIKRPTSWGGNDSHNAPTPSKRASFTRPQKTYAHVNTMIRCHDCRGRGHISRDCPEKLKNRDE